MKPKVKVWVAFSDEMKLGDGRARLLELIDERGSLLQAAKEFEMSYRSAWGYLGNLERAAGFKFVERVPGGGARGGMRLTTRARRFLERYREFHRRIDRVVQKEFHRTFGGEVGRSQQESRGSAGDAILDLCSDRGSKAPCDSVHGTYSKAESSK